MTSDSLPTVLYDEQMNPYRVRRKLGHGGQGVVLEIEGGELAAKVVVPHNSAHRAELVRRYRRLTRRAVSERTRLVMPVTCLAPPFAGYVMRRIKNHLPLTRLLRAPKNKPFPEWYNQDTGGLRRRYLICASVARAFEHIHAEGLAYCDLSDANIFVPEDARYATVHLIDADNLSNPDQAQCLVLGTPRYMAPEIVKGIRQPDVLSDAYSLAVLIFQILRFGHPLLGDTVLAGPPESEEAALRGDLPYVEHPSDHSNSSSRLLPGESLLTSRMRALFDQAFVEGLEDRTRRPTPAQWEEACLLSADQLTGCNACNGDFLPKRTDPSALETQCPWCSAVIPLPATLLFIDQIADSAFDAPIKTQWTSLVLRGAKVSITNRHVLRNAPGEKGDTVVAELQMASNGVRRIRNMADMEITLCHAGKRKLLRTRESAAMADGDILEFGQPIGSDPSIIRRAKLWSPRISQ